MKCNKSLKLRRGLGVAAVVLAVLAATGISSVEPDLTVEARYPREPTGTMHYALALTFSIPGARPLHLESDCCLPIPGPHFRIAATRFVLLGWSSGGSGMQSLHVLSLGIRNGAVALNQELVLTTDRMNAGLLVRPNGTGGIAIGLLRPPADFVHNPEDWSLGLGDESEEPLGLEQLRGLPFKPVARMPGDVFYNPPLGLCPFPEYVAWISETPEGRLIVPSRQGR